MILQSFMLFFPLQDITKNFTESEAAEHLQQLMSLPWTSISIATMQQNIKVQVRHLSSL